MTQKEHTIGDSLASLARLLKMHLIIGVIKSQRILYSLNPVLVDFFYIRQTFRRKILPEIWKIWF